MFWILFKRIIPSALSNASALPLTTPNRSHAAPFVAIQKNSFIETNFLLPSINLSRKFPFSRVRKVYFPRKQRGNENTHARGHCYCYSSPHRPVASRNARHSANLRLQGFCRAGKSLSPASRGWVVGAGDTEPSKSIQFDNLESGCGWVASESLSAGAHVCPCFPHPTTASVRTLSRYTRTRPKCWCNVVELLHTLLQTASLRFPSPSLSPSSSAVSNWMCQTVPGPVANWSKDTLAYTN